MMEYINEDLKNQIRLKENQNVGTPIEIIIPKELGESIIDKHFIEIKKNERKIN